MHLSAHGEAQIINDGSESLPNTLDLLSFLVHLLLVLPGTMYEACCNDTLGTVFSISTCDSPSHAGGQRRRELLVQ